VVDLLIFLDNASNEEKTMAGYTEKRKYELIKSKFLSLPGELYAI
jgi:hypothetical protein